MVEFKRRQRKKKVETRNYYCENIKTISGQCEVFINHRGSDTKKNIAGLLYDHLSRLGIKPFMDSRNMKPGDKLFDEIDAAIRNCKVAVALLSPNYCESRHCLRELALLMESNKRVLPIFWDVEPSELRVNNINGRQFSDEELPRFERALEQVKDTIGLTFDSSKGDWSEFLEVASKGVKNLLQGLYKRSNQEVRLEFKEMEKRKYNLLRRRQIKVETEAWERMVEEYRELQREMCEKKLAPNLLYVKAFFLGWFDPLRDAIEREQKVQWTKKQKSAFANVVSRFLKCWGV